MTDRLNGGSEPQKKRTAQEWCDIGNARLAGLTPYTGKKFQGYAARDDIHWFVNSNGVPTLGPKLK